jgi:hypothetical protein
MSTKTIDETWFENGKIERLDVQRDGSCAEIEEWYGLRSESWFMNGKIKSKHRRVPDV